MKNLQKKLQRLQKTSLIYKKGEKMIEPHKHCPICGTPIPLNELVCSPDCQKVWDDRIAKAKKSRLTLFVVIIIFIIVWAILTFVK